jgi:hypothetical protein
MFKLLGKPYDIEAQKVSILSSIVDQSHSIIKKKGASPKYNVIWMILKKIVRGSGKFCIFKKKEFSNNLKKILKLFFQ